MTNLTGTIADQLEALQATYETLDGFRAVVFDGMRSVVIVAPETLPSWKARAAADHVALAPSCVSQNLDDATRHAVNGLGSENGFWSVGYDALTDSMTAVTTKPAADIVSSVMALDPAETKGAVANGTLRVTSAGPHDFANASRGADVSPFWGARGSGQTSAAARPGSTSIASRSGR